jgi:hypothetical protein
MPWRISPAMTQRLIHSYPVRFVFVVGAVAAAVVIVHYRLLVKKDFHLLRANRHRAGR